MRQVTLPTANLVNKEGCPSICWRAKGGFSLRFLMPFGRHGEDFRTDCTVAVGAAVSSAHYNRLWALFKRRSSTD